MEGEYMIPQVSNNTDIENLINSFGAVSLQQPAAPGIVIQLDIGTVRKALQENTEETQNTEKVRKLFKQFGGTLMVLDLTPLKKQDLVNCKGLSVSLSRYCKGLQSLHLPKASLDDAELGLIGKLRKLRHLNIASNPKVGNYGITLLALLDELRSLNVSYCPKVTEDGFEFIGKYFSKLEGIALDRRKKAVEANAFAKKVIPFFKDLQLSHLSMNYCGISSEDLQSLCEKQWHLESLGVFGCEMSLLELLKSIKCLPALQCLWVDVDKVCRDSLKNLFRYCPHLQMLYSHSGKIFSQFERGNLVRMGEVDKKTDFLEEKTT